MPTLTAAEARANLYSLLDVVSASHEPILITGKRANAVLISEGDWRAVEETMYWLSLLGMRESILEGLNTLLDELSEEAPW